MEERIPIHPIHPIHRIDGMVSSKGEPDGCATCSERTMSICGRKVKRWCLVIALLVLVTIGLAVPMGIYAYRVGEATSCRLTYADDAAISESEMQSWMAGEEWPLSVPTYDPWKRTCVCKGFEDKDPKSLLPTDEVLVWIAPGDLASLSDEGKIAPSLPTSFLNEYRGAYGEKDHVKVCLQQQYVLNLWNLNPSTINATDGGRHCHVSAGAGSSNVEQFFLGWDGALYCMTTYTLSNKINLCYCSTKPTKNIFEQKTVCGSYYGDLVGTDLVCDGSGVDETYKYGCHGGAWVHSTRVSDITIDPGNSKQISATFMCVGPG